MVPKLFRGVYRLGKPEPKFDPEMDPELRMVDTDERAESFDVDVERSKQIRRGIDLATTLERIAKNFVITDPRLPDNPIVSGSVLVSCFLLRRLHEYLYSTGFQ